MPYQEPILLVDCVGSAELYLNESRGNGHTFFRGKFQEANRTNKNKREYKFEALDRNVKTLMESVKAKGLYGELDHPTDSIVHLANASHMVTNLWWEGKVLMGEAMIMPTPSGRVLKGIIEAGGRIGISSRGVGNGSTNSDGILVIDESYKLITFDAVADPSTFDAYQKRYSRKENFEPQAVVNPIRVEENARYNFNPEVLIGLAEILAETHVRKIRNRK